MALRTINYSVTMADILPKTVQDGGIQGDTNITNVIFKLSADLVSALTAEEGSKYTLGYRIDATDSSGGYHPSEMLIINSADNTITYALPEELTSVSGICKLHLIISLLDSNNVEVEILFSCPAMIKISGSSNASEAEIAVKREITGAEKAAIAAKISAETAATSANAYASAAETSKTAAVTAAASAGGFATNASNSANAAANSATASGNFAASSSTKAAEATASASAALASENSAKTSKTDSAASAVNAAASASAAETSKTNAASSASAAAASAAAAETSKTNAASSASAAATSAASSAGAANTAVSAHNTDSSAHSDIRAELTSAHTSTVKGITFADLKSRLEAEETDVTNAIATAGTNADTKIGAHNNSDTAHADIRTSVTNAIATSGTNADTKIATHNTSGTAHSDIRTSVTNAITTAGTNADTKIGTHNTSGTAHSDIRISVTNAITTAGTNADTKISTHNTSTTAHADIRSNLIGHDVVFFSTFMTGYTYEFANVDTTAMTLTLPTPHGSDGGFIINGTLYSFIAAGATCVISLTKTISSSLGKIMFKLSDKTFSIINWSTPTSASDYVLLGSIRYSGTAIGAVYLNFPHTIDGKLYGLVDYVKSNRVLNTLDAPVKAVNHRGYNTVAPENTLPAFQMSKNKGFSYVETDIRWTSDGVAVLSHNGDINTCGRNADGSAIVKDQGKTIGSYTILSTDIGKSISVIPVSGDIGKTIGSHTILDSEVGTTILVTPTNTINISEITYAALLNYDFGIYKSSTYTGTKMPTFEQFIILCKKLNLHPYLEMKDNPLGTRATDMATILKKHNMTNHVTFITFSSSYITNILSAIPTARIGYMIPVDDQTITKVNAVKTATNNIFIDCNYLTEVNETYLNTVLGAGISVELYLMDTSTLVSGWVDKGISGFTTGSLNIAEILGN